VNLLLDSHTLLWLMEASPSLSRTARALIGDPANRLHLSMASIWEIGIKVGLKKMGLSVPFATFLETAVNGYGLIIVSITTDDCINYEGFAIPESEAPRSLRPHDCHPCLAKQLGRRW
jgi:PIN domain nuclease of toxin-antitoxin system